jgi:drug/metabolite transporter (DMT)-like permease
MNWLIYSLMTALFFGLYGIFLHTGQIAMKDPVLGRYKAFLFVGVAYLVIAIIVPIILLKFQGASFKFPMKGISLSFVAGLLGALGAFCILLAFGAKGTPAAVMSIVFAGAPVVNAIVSMKLHPPQGGVSAIPWQFFLGIVLAALGGCLVTVYKPAPAPAHAKSPPPAAISESDTRG